MGRLELPRPRRTRAPHTRASAIPPHGRSVSQERFHHDYVWVLEELNLSPTSSQFWEGNGFTDRREEQHPNKRDHGESNPEPRIDSARCFRYTMAPEISSGGSRTLSISRSEREWSACYLPSCRQPDPGAGIEPATSTFRAWCGYQQPPPRKRLEFHGRGSGRRIRTSIT